MACEPQIQLQLADTVYKSDTLKLQVPDFYQLRQYTIKDTDYSVVLYDKNNVELTSWNSFDEVSHAIIYKCVRHGISSSNISKYAIGRYTRKVQGYWSFENYVTGKSAEFQEDRRNIISFDMKRTQSTDIGGPMSLQITIHCFTVYYIYYKLVRVDR